MRTFSRVQNKSNDRLKSFAAALLATVILTYSGMYGLQAASSSSSPTLTATVAAALTFTVSTDQFPTINPGTIAYATTTLAVATNESNGWNVTLLGTNKTTSNNNLQLAGNTASIPDQTEWIPPAGNATTTTGNAVVRGSLTNSGNVLAFRVMTASSSNGAAFTSSSWWGATDVDGVAKWAGIASTTGGPRYIGNAGAGSYSASTHLNTVQYYLLASITQPTGAYSAPLTYTATSN
jgi:hypothetical protein